MVTLSLHSQMQFEARRTVSRSRLGFQRWNSPIWASRADQPFLCKKRMRNGPSPPAKRWLTVKNERPLTRVGGVHVANTEVIYAVLFNAEVGQPRATSRFGLSAELSFWRGHRCEFGKSLSRAGDATDVSLPNASILRSSNKTDEEPTTHIVCLVGLIEAARPSAVEEHHKERMYVL